MIKRWHTVVIIKILNMYQLWSFAIHILSVSCFVNTLFSLLSFDFNFRLLFLNMSDFIYNILNLYTKYYFKERTNHTWPTDLTFWYILILLIFFGDKYLSNYNVALSTFISLNWPFPNVILCNKIFNSATLSEQILTTKVNNIQTWPIGDITSIS